jgi:phosphate transport system permease protein
MNSNLGAPIIIPAIGWRRRATDRLMTTLAVLTVLIVLLPLGAIFGYLVYKGIGSINLAFLTQTPKPVGEAGGGMANAIAGSAVILAIASLLGVPFGIGAGIFLSEYGRNRYGDAVRFVSDVLNGVPSIVIGIVAYGLVVMRQKHFSALAGGVALAIMMVPTIARTTISITLRTATSGVITGVMLAFARVAGETAPLLFTAFGNQFWNWRLGQPTAALSLQIYTYALSPFDDWHRQAWAGSLVLIVLIVSAVAAVRMVVRHGRLAGA